jgi:hypothetical protein
MVLKVFSLVKKNLINNISQTIICNCSFKEQSLNTDFSRRKSQSYGLDIKPQYI